MLGRRWHAAHAVAPGVLGRIQRLVGVVDQGGKRVVRHLERRNANADRRVHGPAFPLEAQLRHATSNALGGIERAERVGVRQEDRKFFTAEASEQVGLAQRIAGGASNLAQQQVAGQVAMHVVDLLEQVDVDHQQGGRHVVAPAARPFAVGEHQKLAPVVYAGEFVARGQHVELARARLRARTTTAARARRSMA